MARIKLTLSANAGGALQLSEHRVLIDALHKQKVPGFSTMNEDRQNALFIHPEFSEPEWIIYTHCHSDHYSQELTAKAVSLWPNAKLRMPGTWTETAGDMQIACFPLSHDGAGFQNTPHYGILITWRGKNILIPGDCAVADAELLRIVDGRRIDLAILNFPWLTLRKGRTCLENVLRPGKCVFWHLPFAEDDVSGYRASAEAALKQYPGTLLYHPFQILELDI